MEKVGNVSTEKVKSLSRTKTPVAKVAINSIPIRLTVDSGVTVTILNYKDWLQIATQGSKQSPPQGSLLGTERIQNCPYAPGVRSPFNPREERSSRHVFTLWKIQRQRAC